MKILIGITPRLFTDDNTEKEYVNTSYLDFLRKRGANVIMLTFDNPDIDEVLALCDGFVITGGSDVDPKYFGEENVGLSKGVIPRMDNLDKAVVEYSQKHHIPMLGICRGHQCINVFLGGSLHQHIGEEHRNLPFDHVVKTTKNSILPFDEEIIINSYHHQAINKVAPEMSTIARHADGTIEAIIHNTLPIIGVQWHPEKVAHTKESNIIFDRFFELINTNKKC